MISLLYNKLNIKPTHEHYFLKRKLTIGRFGRLYKIYTYISNCVPNKFWSIFIAIYWVLFKIHTASHLRDKTNHLVEYQSMLLNLLAI